MLALFLPVSIANFLIQIGFRIDRQHIRAHKEGVQLIEYLRRCSGADLPASLAGDAGQIEETVIDTGLFQTLALCQNILGGVALAQEGKGRVIPGFNANRQPGITRLPESVQIFIRLVGRIRNASEAADAQR